MNIKLTTDALSLNNNVLQQGEYTITTSSSNISGNGFVTSPNFTGSASINSTDSTIKIGPATGTIKIDDTRLTIINGLTITGFDGTASITTGTTKDTIELNGDASHILQVSTDPPSLTTDQNTPVNFNVIPQTSLDDTYDIIGEVPEGWKVEIDENALVTVTPAPGLQEGTFPIHITVKSQTIPDLTAHGKVNVTSSGTEPGVSVQIVADELFTIPVNDAQLPSAFKAEIRNPGPLEDTFELTFPQIPAGFEILNSGTLVTIPAGEKAEIGIYLKPMGEIDPPGTSASFSISVTSKTDPSITDSDSELFVIPEVHELILSTSSTTLSISPGDSVSADLTLKSAGNVQEEVSLRAKVPDSINLTGIPETVSLALGESKDFPLSFTVDSNAAIDQTLSVDIIADLCNGIPQESCSVPQPIERSTTVALNIRSKEAALIESAAQLASQIGNTDLAEILFDLSEVLSQLQANPADDRLLERLKLILDNLMILLQSDPTLSQFILLLQDVLNLISTRDLDELLTLILELFSDIEVIFIQLTSHSFTMALSSSSVELQPGESREFTFEIENTGTEQTTITLDVGVLPINVNAHFNVDEIKLNPGEVIDESSPNPIILILDQSVQSSQFFSLIVTGTAVEAPDIQKIVSAHVGIRPALVDVLSAAVDPFVVESGESVAVRDLPKNNLPIFQL